MSKREARREWHDFKDRFKFVIPSEESPYDVTMAGFVLDYKEMFGSEPAQSAIDTFRTKLDQLKLAVGKGSTARDRAADASKPAAPNLFADEPRQRRKKKSPDTGVTITVSCTISMGHRLPSYNGICSSMHGHNVRVVATINVTGFTDFKEVSDMLWIALDPLDHAMVMHEGDPFVPQLKQWPQRLVLLNVEPTTEALAQYIFNMMRNHYTVASVTVFETDKYTATVTAQSDVRRVE